MMGRIRKFIGALRATSPSAGGSGGRASFLWTNKSGVHVDEQIAMTYTAFWRCVNLISSTVAALPFHVYRMEGQRRTVLPADPVDSIIHVAANDEIPSLIFRETVQANALTWGNGYAEIETLRNGTPAALWQIEPPRVDVAREKRGGRLIYDVYNGNGQSNTVLPPSSVFHLRGLGFDGLKGYSPVQLFKQAIGMGLAMEKYGAAYFGNGSMPGGVLETDDELDKEVRDRVAESWASMHQGPDNAHRVAILEDGLKWKAAGIPNETAQFLESRQFQGTEMARIFGVPPHMIADLDRSTNNNIEQQAIEFVVYCVFAWVRRWEAESDFKLLGRAASGRYTRMSLDALMRGDSKQRSDFYKTMRDLGCFSPNDILALEDRDPVPDGDVRLVPMNMVKLADAGKNPKNTPSNDPNGAPPGGDGTTPANQTLVSSLVNEAVSGAIGHELARARRKESMAIERAESKYVGKGPAFKEWLVGFLEEHRAQLCDSLAHSAQAVARFTRNSLGMNPHAPEGTAAALAATEQFVNDRLSRIASDAVEAFHAGALVAMLEGLAAKDEPAELVNAVRARIVKGA